MERANKPKANGPTIGFSASAAYADVSICAAPATCSVEAVAIMIATPSPN